MTEIIPDAVLASPILSDRGAIVLDMTYLTPSLAGAALIVSVIALIVAIRRPRVDQRFDGARLAADELTTALQSLRSIMWSAATVAPDPDPAVVRDVTCAADLVCRAHRARLPRSMRNLRLSVSQAVANYFGGSSTYAVDPRTEIIPLHPHDAHGWDIGIDYLEYAIDVLQQWRDNPKQRDLTLCPYDQWRKDEDEAQHAARSDTKLSASKA
jgi:hypothetical protein